MTAKKLRLFYVILLSSVGVLMIIGFVIFQWADCYWELYKTLIPLVITISVAFITKIYQQRQSFVKSVETLWDRMLPAFNNAIQVTHQPAKNPALITETFIGLDISIDLIRSTFKNYNGLYPFENLKDIKLIISNLNYKPWDPNNNKIARNCINSLWWEMYNALLEELDRPVPTRPVSKFLHEGQRSIADEFIDGRIIKREDIGNYISPSNANPKNALRS